MLNRFGIIIGTLLSLGAAQALAEDPLRPEDAFRYEVTAVPGELLLDWDVEPGYYLYKQKISFATDTAGVTLGEPVMPRGEEKEDEFFGKSEVYRGSARIAIPYSSDGDVDALQLQVRSQGCADMGLCYPPQAWSRTVALPAAADASLGGGLPAGLGRGAGLGLGDSEFLHPDDAFRFYAEMADDYTIRAHWDIAEGYYLYRDKFAFSAQSRLAQLGSPTLPRGKKKHDEFFGEVEVFYNDADVRLAISRASPAAGELELTATFQGCAEDGICYPPTTRTALVAISAASTEPPPPGAGGLPAAPVAEQDRLASLISGGSLPLVLLTFFGLGLLLAFTPCVLPMVPILSGIIAGQGAGVTTRRAFTLSLVYVLAMALTYTAAGVAVAMLGQNIQAFFQNPWIVVAFSLIFVALALAMFDVYEFQMPGLIQTRLANVSNQQSGGKLAGVGIMGVLSALIVGPCVAAPLVAVLIFIGQSGDALRGGLTLFALSLGMGAPLLAFGASAGRLMVKAGPWMNTIKQLFGLMLLGVGIWMLSRIIPPGVTMVLWGLLAVGAGIVLGAFKPSPGRGRLLARAAGVLILGYGAVLGASAAVGGIDPLNPLRGTPWHHETHLEFQRVKTVEDLDRAIAEASADGRTVMLDFYADWCVSCKEMEKYTFTNETVQANLADTVLLQADVTANDEADQAMLKRFGIYGPPTIAFFDAGGAEIEAYRVVGFMPAERFSAHVSDALAQ